MTRLRLTLLGVFEARVMPLGRRLELPRRKARALLAYLALSDNGIASRDTLTTLLWSTLDQRGARNNFRVTLFALRKALVACGLECLHVDHDIIVLDPRRVDVDAIAFEGLAADTTVRLLARAAGLYRGDLLAGLRVDEPPFDEWRAAQQERLHLLAQRVVEALIRGELQRAQRASALRLAQRVLEFEPTSEPAHRAVMKLHADAGHYGAALRQYQVCTGVLRRELGVPPDATTETLYQKVLRQRGRTTMPRTGEQRRHVSTVFGRWREPPFVGRSSEMTDLADALGAAAAGRGNVVAILGEAGVGKTRLIAEWEQGPRRKGARVVLGRAYESQRGTAFAPWLDAFRQGGFIGDRRVLDGFDPAWIGELARLFPELGHPPPPDPTQDIYGRLFEAMTQLICYVSTNSLLVLVLEDLHSADDLSLKCLAFLGHRVKTWPVLVIVTARPDELNAQAQAILEELDRDNSASRVIVKPLSKSDVARLVAATLDRSTHAINLTHVSQEAWAVSRGNPFIVVQSLRARTESDTGQGLLSGLEQIIAARLNQLGSPARTVVELAAALGQPFDLAFVQRATGFDEFTAARALDELAGRRLVEQCGAAFDFVHETIRTVICGRLGPTALRAAHGAVASAIEAHFSAALEHHYPAVAEHYHAAERWDRAIEFWRRAGVAAAVRGRYAEAVHHHERALALTDRLPEADGRLALEVDIRLDLRNALFPLGEFSRALEHLTRAEMTVRQLDDLRRLGLISTYLCNSLLLAGRASDGPVFGETACAIAIQLGDLPLQATASYHLAATDLALGHHDRAEALFKDVITIIPHERWADRLGLTGLPVVFARNLLAFSLADRGQFGEAVTIAQEAVRLSEEFNHPYSLAQALWSLGHVYSANGDWRDAEPALRRGLQLAREHALWHIAWSLMSTLALVCAHSDSTEESLALIRDAVAHVTDKQTFGFHLLVLVQAATVLLIAGRPNDAEDLALRALNSARRSGQRPLEAQALICLAEIGAHQECADVQNVRLLAESGLAIARELDLRPLERRGRLSLAAIAEEDGASQRQRTEELSG